MNHLIAFDLDGTLVDTPSAVAKGFSHTLSALDLPVATEDKIRSTIGLPLEIAFASLIGDHSPYISKCIELYRSYYFAEIVPQAQSLIFAGVRDGLTTLKKAGYLLAVATNKQTQSATALLVHAELYHLFDFVAGADLVRDPKPAPDILQLLSRHFQLDAKKILFVGDTVHDLECAKNFSVECAAVTYGVGSASDLCGASFLAPQFSTIVDWILETRTC
jgi:phosphoglycolate phosphatase